MKLKKQNSTEFIFRLKSFTQEQVWFVFLFIFLFSLIPIRCLLVLCNFLFLHKCKYFNNNNKQDN